MRFSILGCGNGGHAMAADLSLRGFEVNLYEIPRFAASIKPIMKSGGIHLTGMAGSGFVPVNLATTEIDKALKDTDVVMVVVPAYAHKIFAEKCSPHAEGKTIVLNPGSTGGAIVFARFLKEKKVKDVTVAETQSLIYACRLTGPAQVDIHGIKRVLQVAAIPSRKTPKVIRLLNKAYPQIVAATNVLETSLNNVNATSHPVITLLNSGRIESTKGDFLFYHSGVTPSVCRVLDAIERENLSIKRALGLEAIPQTEWVRRWYGAKGQSYGEVVQNCYAYAGSKAPPTLQHRYLNEDVPFGLVPMASIGDIAGVETPNIKSMIDLASVVNNTDYWDVGRNVDKLGFHSMSVADVLEHVTEGSP